MKKLRIAFLLTLLLLVGCGGSSAGTHVWIDVPINNLFLTNTQPINIEGHASNPGGVSLVEVLVNDILIDSIIPISTSADIIAFETIFTPSISGEYTIQVIAFGVDETTSNPDTAVVQIGELAVISPTEETPTTIHTSTFTPTPTPVFTSTPTETPTEVATDTLEPVINYWTDFTEIPAGSCVTLYWDVANVSRVVFGGVDQEFSGSDSECICESQTYPLQITHLDDTEETLWITINVTGSCATDTPEPDTTTPDPPVLLKPLDESILDCTSETILRWEASSDPSGIIEYQVEVERNVGTWQPVSGSVFEDITETEMLFSFPAFDCGQYYRWRVRAIDGANNIGEWSDWFEFSVDLT